VLVPKDSRTWCQYSHLKSRADLLIPSKGELWTLGGSARQLKLSGRKNYTYYSWAICQRLDDSPATTTKNVEIPTKEIKMEDRRHLSISESRALFKKRLLYMEGSATHETGKTDQTESRSCSSTAPNLFRYRSSFLLTPPTSPAQQLLQLQQLQQTQEKVAIQNPQYRRPPLARPWRGIFELSGPRRGTYVLRNSLIHPQQLTQSRIEPHPHPLASTEVDSEDSDSSMNDAVSTRSYTHPSSPPLAPGTKNTIDDLQGAYLLHEICRREAEKENRRGSSNIGSSFPDDDDADIYLDAASPREAWEAHRPHTENKILTERCSERDPWCPYTRLSTKIHFHCPKEKCRLILPSKVQKRTHDSPIGGERRGERHEHCVSRLGPYPESAGECHLLNSRLEEFRDHRCCEWVEADLATITVRGRRAYETRKTNEARRTGGMIFDRRGEIMVGGWIEIGSGNPVLDNGGVRWLEGLQRGELDEAIQGLMGEGLPAGGEQDVGLRWR
jgi:hypothetical protein